MIIQIRRDNAIYCAPMSPIKVDLHCHSRASDGQLSPEDLLLRARAQEIELLAITDHDCIDGYLQVSEDSEALRLIAGVELSCVWGKTLIHIVGLNMNTDDPQLRQGLASQQQAREDRARQIGDRLASKGFSGGYAFAKQRAGNSQIGRPHFAQFLVEKGHVASEQQAFKRYLGAGKIGDVKNRWPAMAEVVGWITAAGGIAVLAHPLYYKMTNTKLKALIADFKEAGGKAIEVVSGRQPRDRSDYLARLADEFGLYASAGSDFHRPQPYGCELGGQPALPKSCRPVWEQFI